jgi:hypothetical protein
MWDDAAGNGRSPPPSVRRGREYCLPGEAAATHPQKNALVAGIRLLVAVSIYVSENDAFLHRLQPVDTVAF